MKTKTWIAIFAALFAISIAAALVIPRVGGGRTANIYREGKCIMSIDLDKVEEAYTFTLEDEEGHINVIEVEPGRIRVASANCPDKVCVDRGWLESGSRPIVCLPARLVIKLAAKAEADDFDAVSGYCG